MKFEERKILLKDGRTCVLKPNSPEYAQEMLDYLRKTSAETEYLLRYPDEVKFTLESEKEILGNLLENPYAIMMIAVVDGKVAGNGSVNGIGDKRKIQHRCSLAIALYEEFWGLGIGTAMIDYMSELAGQIGWKHYKKCGFIETGRRHNALKFDDGSFHDEILMYKDL